MKYFTKECPAASITELLNALRSDHHPSDLYRGQTKDYAALVPSIFRDVLVEGTQNDPFPQIMPGAAADVEALHNNHKYRFARELFKEFGLAVGNIVSQQYGLSSETIDVTGDIETAGYFATRKYPDYSHLESAPYLGVIYRFRGKSDNNPKPELDSSLGPLTDLNLWFSSGLLGDVEFEYFLLEGQLHQALDMHRWYDEGQDAVVSTMPLTLSCDAILKIVDAERRRAEKFELSVASHPLKWLKDRVLKADWRTSRLYGQTGGLIRPRILFNARVSNTYEVFKNSTERAQKLAEQGITMPVWRTAPYPRPRAFPGLAVKSSIKAIENIRYRPECEVFYFKHSKVRVTGKYRTGLWPEPDRDEVFGSLWSHLLTLRMSGRILGDKRHPFDDEVHGYFDNGYTVNGKRTSASQDRSAQVFLGQLQDAEESIENSGPMADNLAKKVWAHVGRAEWYLGAMTAIDLLRRFPENPDALYALTIIFWVDKKKLWSTRTGLKLVRIAPNDARSKVVQSKFEFEIGNFSHARDLLLQANANWQPDLLGLTRTDIKVYLEQMDKLIASRSTSLE